MDSSKCKIHPPIFISYFGEGLHNRGIVAFKVSTKKECLHLHGLIRIPGVHELHPQTTVVLRLLKKPKRKVDSGLTCSAKFVNKNWIDKTLLCEWKRSCDEGKHKICREGNASMKLPRVHPAWLIDTWRLCLVPGSTNIPYVALSYVWGKIPFFKTTEQNIDQLQEESALAFAHEKLGVPRTISDAIETVGLLEERYLWVDALCVVQDDSLTRHKELNKMASIFHEAVVTIIAEQGEDANYGLRGLRGISQSRKLAQNVFRPGNGYEFVHIKDPEPPKSYIKNSEATTSLWCKRGWTYQEDLFSKRRLVSQEWSSMAVCMQ